MKQYFWIRLYISFSPIIAVLSALLFIGWLFLVITQYREDVSDVSYRENVKIGEALNQAQGSYMQTDSFIEQFEKASGLPHDTLPAVDSFIGPYDNEARLKDDLGRIQKMQADVQTLKGSLFSKVESRWTTFVDKLLRHAASVSASDASTTATPKPQDEPFALYCVDTDQIKHRAEDVDSAKDAFALLATQAEDPTNKQQIKDTGDQLGKIEGILKLYLAQDSNSQNATPAADTADDDIASLRVAVVLNSSLRIVKHDLFSDWSVDQQLSNAQAIVSHEIDLYHQSQEEIWQNTRSLVVECIIGIMAFVVCLFLLLVPADLLRICIRPREVVVAQEVA